MGRNNTALMALMTAVLLVTGTLGMTFASAPASAQTEGSEDGSVVDGLFFDEGESGENDGTFRAVYAATMGLLDKYSPFTDRPEESDSGEYAENFQSEFNANSEVLMNWTNARVTGDKSADVVRLKFTDEDDGTTYLFVVSDVSSSGNYTNATVMNATEFRNSGREHDLTYRLSPYASRNAEQELETFVEDYAGPNSDVTKQYLSHLAGEYRGEIEGEGIPGGD